MPRLEIADHPLLTSMVLALESPAREAQQDLAEDMLDITDAVVAAADEDQTKTLTTAVVLQLNFAVAQGLTPLYVKRESSNQQAESKEYRDTVIDPRAAQLVSNVLAAIGEPGAGSSLVDQFDRIPGTRSVRTRGGGGVPTRTIGRGGR